MNFLHVQPEHCPDVNAFSSLRGWVCVCVWARPIPSSFLLYGFLRALFSIKSDYLKFPTFAILVKVSEHLLCLP